MMEGPLVLAEMVRRFEFRLIESSAEPELGDPTLAAPSKRAAAGIKIAA